MNRQTTIALLAVAASFAFDAASAPAVPPAVRLLRPRRQPVVPARAGHALCLGRCEGRRARARRHDGDAQDAHIDGAPCVVVDDRLYLRGRLAERTTDWYAQDSNGNVWYFGEDTAELDRNGRVTSTAGTWRRA